MGRSIEVLFDSAPLDGLTCDHVPLVCAESSKSDRAALMALFEATNGHEWSTDTFWGTDIHVAFGAVFRQTARAVGKLSLSVKTILAVSVSFLALVVSLWDIQQKKNKFTHISRIPRQLGVFWGLLSVRGLQLDIEKHANT